MIAKEKDLVNRIQSMETSLAGYMQSGFTGPTVKTLFDRARAVDMTTPNALATKEAYLSAAIQMATKEIAKVNRDDKEISRERDLVGLEDSRYRDHPVSKLWYVNFNNPELGIDPSRPVAIQKDKRSGKDILLLNGEKRELPVGWEKTAMTIS